MVKAEISRQADPPDGRQRPGKRRGIYPAGGRSPATAGRPGAPRAPSGPGRSAAEISPASASDDRSRGDPAFRPSARLSTLPGSDFRNMIGTKSLSRPIRFGLSGIGPTNSLSRPRSSPMPRPAVFARSVQLSSSSRPDPPGRSDLKAVSSSVSLSTGGFCLPVEFEVSDWRRPRPVRTGCLGWSRLSS